MTSSGRSLARLLPPLALLFAGSSCGSSSPAPVPVAALSDAEAQSLCQQFFTAACAAGKDAATEPSCTGCDPCTQATSVATIRAVCGDGITDADVRHCVSSGFDMPTCTGPERGGCMFDVGDTLCPVTTAP